MATESRFRADGDGRVRTLEPACAYPFWADYLRVFDEVVVLGRVADDTGRRPGAGAGPGPGLTVDGERVRVVGLPAYRGPTGYLRALPQIQKIIRTRVIGPRQAHLARLPGLVGGALAAELRRQRLPYALEVCGDPAEVMAGGRGGPLAGWAAGRALARQCASAAAVSYVTAGVLQRRYPPAPGAPTASYSRPRLEDDDFVAAGRTVPAPPTPARLLAIGSQERDYKGHDVLIDATARMLAAGPRVHVTIVGAGRQHEKLVRQARRRGLGAAITFIDRLAGWAEVRAALDAADLFVMPSRTEGLPRVLVEASARALPAVGSAVGGIIELLAADDLVPPGDPVRLAGRLTEMITRPGRLTAASARNLATARAYANEETGRRALAYYRRVADLAATPSHPSHPSHPDQPEQPGQPSQPDQPSQPSPAAAR